MRRSLIVAPVDAFLPSFESIPRERISSRAIQLYMASQLRSLAAWRPFAALHSDAPPRLPAAAWLPRLRIGLGALGMF